MSDEPLEVRAPRGARVMEIEWADAATSRLPHRVLRGFCPCAHCQGHQGPIQWVDVDLDDAALELTELSEAGNYALRIGWADGHNTGIYTFRYLRQLGSISERPLAEIKAHRFSR